MYMYNVQPTNLTALTLLIIKFDDQSDDKMFTTKIIMHFEGSKENKRAVGMLVFELFFRMVVNTFNVMLILFCLKDPV